MESITVTGGTAAIKGRLVADHGWDGNVPYALLSHRIGEDGEIQSSNWLLLGTLKPVVFPINSIWTGAHKGTRINIDFKDLAVFEFPPRSNTSHWLDSTALRISYTEKRTGGVMAPLDEASILNKGIGVLSVRAHIIPTATRVAQVWLTVAPYSLDTLKERLGAARLNSPQIPTISLPLARIDGEGTSKSVEAILGVPEPQGLGIDIEAAAFIDVTTAPNVPPPSALLYKDATIGTYRAVTSMITTTAKSVATKFNEFLNGNVANLRKPKEVFREFINPETNSGS